METTRSTLSGLEPLLSIEELAAYLDVPVTTIRDWRTDDKGPCWIRRFSNRLRQARSRTSDDVRRVLTAPYVGSAGARVWLVEGGRHDILNDVSHRSVAATVVLFLESLKLGAELPPVLVPAGAAR